MLLKSMRKTRDSHAPHACRTLLAYAEMKLPRVLAFADDLTLRALTDKEMLECAGDLRIIRAQRARLLVMKERKK